MEMTMSNEDWKCCDCPKYKAHKHEELCYFGNYGNNTFKVEDKNARCEEHFKKAEVDLDVGYEKHLIIQEQLRLKSEQEAK